LMWRLTTTIAHIGNIKKRFHKKQGYGGHYYMKCGKNNPYSTHPCVPTNLESDGAWGVRSQHLPNVIYAVKFPSTKIFCCTCEWALWGNMCNHQIMVIFTCTCGSSLGSVRVYSLTLSCTPGNMQHGSWAPLLARNLVTPCFGREPKLGLQHYDSTWKRQ
jgi:hypothetical protein